MYPFVIYWNNIPTPYMVERFNVLTVREAFEFEVWFNDRIEEDRSWTVDESTWIFPYRYMPTICIGRHKLHFPLPLLFGRRPDVLVSLYAAPSFVIGWFIAKLRGIKTGFRVLKTYDSWVSRRPIKDILKRFLFNRVDFIETPGEDGKSFAMQYGALSDRIFIATHAVDVSHFSSKCAESRLQRDSLRKELGLQGTTFMYVGRLWRGKGIYYLLDAFERVQCQSEAEVSLLLVGDGAEAANLEHQCTERGLRNVVFAGYIQKPELPRYYALADVFVFPTLGDPYGLVVDEAMACSLPIITTNAAGEIHARIEEGVNGFIVPSEDGVVLAERMLLLSQNLPMCEQMGKFSYEKIKTHTPLEWAEDFERIVQSVYKRFTNLAVKGDE